MTMERIHFFDMHPVNSQLHAYTEEMLGVAFANCTDSGQSFPHRRTEEVMVSNLNETL